jgi:hypothetical protein
VPAGRADLSHPDSYGIRNRNPNPDGDSTTECHGDSQSTRHVDGYSTSDGDSHSTGDVDGDSTSDLDGHCIADVNRYGLADHRPFGNNRRSARVCRSRFDRLARSGRAQY